MIKLYSNFDQDYNKKIEHTFEITKFPDNTSQVWKINPEPQEAQFFEIKWEFENEAELFHVCQLADLVCEMTHRLPRLYMPYLVCGRQDKPVKNDKTFALITLHGILTNFFRDIITIDAHSDALAGHMIAPITSEIPNKRINEVLKLSDADLVCFPDKGAAKRRYSYDTEYFGAPIILDKERNQETGEILGLKFTTKFKPDLSGYKVCLIDDICDGGRTFVEAAKLLKEQKAKEVILYTTHGIYSKGVNYLFDNGIDKVYNYKEEVIKDGIR